MNCGGAVGLRNESRPAVGLKRLYDEDSPSTITNSHPFSSSFLHHSQDSLFGISIRDLCCNETDSSIPLFVMSSTVHVQGISSQTTEKEVRDFFSFWYACRAL